jgi:hypothetical protein
MQIWSTNSGWFQIFKYNGQNIVNIKDGRVLDVEGGKDREGQDVFVWKRHNGLNQRWAIVYLDEKKPEPTKGLDEDSGLYRNRPFYIQSRLPGRRAITVTHHKLVIRKLVRDE